MEYERKPYKSINHRNKLRFNRNSDDAENKSINRQTIRGKSYENIIKKPATMGNLAIPLPCRKRMNFMEKQQPHDSVSQLVCPSLKPLRILPQKRKNLQIIISHNPHPKPQINFITAYGNISANHHHLPYTYDNHQREQNKK